MTFAKDLIEGKIKDFSETDKEQQNEGVNDSVNEMVKLGVKLGVNQIEILKYIELDNYITIREMSQKINISETAVQNNIKKLKNSGILERVGSDKTGYWKVYL